MIGGYFPKIFWFLYGYSPFFNEIYMDSEHNSNMKERNLLLRLPTSPLEVAASFRRTIPMVMAASEMEVKEWLVAWMWLVCTINNQDLIWRLQSACKTKDWAATKESIALAHNGNKTLLNSEHTSLSWEVSSSLGGKLGAGKRTNTRCSASSQKLLSPPAAEPDASSGSRSVCTLCTHQAKSTNPRNYRESSHREWHSEGHTRHGQVSKCVYSMFESFYEDKHRDL